MTNYRFAFYHSAKNRTTAMGYMLAEGARRHGDVVELLPQESFEPSHLTRYDGACNLGMARACKLLMDAYLAAGKHFMYFDKGYFDRDRYIRVSVDAWQPLAYFQRFKRSSDRWKKFRIEPIGRRKMNSESTIVLAGACQNYHNFADLPTVTEWCQWAVDELRSCTNRPIIYRPNPSWATKHSEEFSELEGTLLSPPNEPFDRVLRNCHLLVTHGSSAALGAMLKGVPVYVMGDGICKPMGINTPLWEACSGPERVYLIEHPRWMKDQLRYQFYSDVAYCQWNHNEYRSGEAWNEIRWILSYLRGQHDAIPSTKIIGQYRVMHQSPRYFRGLSTVKYADVVGNLIKKHKARTVLDFGCGKGDQYRMPFSLQARWGVAATLYDPAVRAYDALPKGTYDGVLCIDVMEHVPELDVPYTLRTIFERASKFVFLTIASTPATKSLPDGRNCHVTVYPEAWWWEKIKSVLPYERQLDVTLVMATSDD